MKRSVCSRVFLATAAVLLLVLSGSARAASVYVIVPSNTLTIDPLFVSGANPPGTASADLQSGYFEATLEGTPGITGASEAGIRAWPNALKLTNNTGASVVIEAGEVSAHVLGLYTLSSGGGAGGSSSARCTVTLSGKKGGTTNTVSAFHRVTKTFDSDGNVTGSPNTFTPTPGLGSIVPVTTSLESLELYLNLPGYLLAPGESVDVWFSVDVTGASTVGTGSAGCTGQMAIAVDLDHDAGIDLPWVGTPSVPALGPAGLVALSGLLAATAVLRRRTRAM